MRFDHETLDAYRLAVEIARWFSNTRFARGDADLKNQALRASRSMVLNIAEGRSRRPDQSEMLHYRVALASAAECCAVLDCAPLPDGEARQEELRRVRAMLEGLMNDGGRR